MIADKHKESKWQCIFRFSHSSLKAKAFWTSYLILEIALHFLAKNEKVQKDQNEVGLVLHPLLVIASWKIIVHSHPRRQLSSDVNNITQGGNRNSLHK